MKLLQSWQDGAEPSRQAVYAEQARAVHQARRIHVENYDYPCGVRKARYRLVSPHSGEPLLHPETGKTLKSFTWLHWDRVGTRWLLGRPQGWLPRWYGEDRLEGNATVWVCEGERDADGLRQLGHLAVCAPDGASSRTLPDPAPLLGRRVLVVADHDDAGLRFARTQAVLLGVDHILVPPVAGHDVSDHLGAGGSLDDLLELSSIAPPGEQDRP